MAEPAMPILDPLAMPHAAFAEAARGLGVPRERALGVYAGFYRDGRDGRDGLTVGAADASADGSVVDGGSFGRHGMPPHRSPGGTLPFALPEPPVPVKVQASEAAEGEVRKFLLRVPRHAENINRRAPGTPGDARLPDDLETESVIIPMAHRGGRSFTLCVSSQVGCAMGCEFCETAQMGLIRSLQPREIVAQWHAARHALGAEIKNIVFMGMGEPLDNAQAVLEAITILTDHRGPAIAMKNITISTVGRLDGLALLGERIRQDGWKRLNLAVSINAPNDAIRSEIMPINRGMPLGELIPMLINWPMRSSSAICCEYVLIPGVNDAPEHADELAAMLKPVRCCVNVIPYNPRRNSPWPAPTEEATWAFLRRLESHGQFCKYRRTKGRETMAACGQLGNEQIRGRKLVGVTIAGE